MSANPTVIKLIYECGSRQTISCPDMSFADGAFLQSGFIDLSHIDEGIYWWREAMLSQGMQDESAGEEGEFATCDTWYQIDERAKIISGERLKRVVIVAVDGDVAFVRHPGAAAECGLASVFDGELHRLSGLSLKDYVGELLVGNMPDGGIGERQDAPGGGSPAAGEGQSGNPTGIEEGMPSFDDV